MNPETLRLSPLEARRVRVRDAVRRAAVQLAPSWPLERFVATNPLLALEDRPVEQAAREAVDLLGLRAEHDETTYRRWYEEGRITDLDLTAAILEDESGYLGREAPLSEPDVTAIRTELLSAPPVSLPRPRPVLMSERHDVAAGTDWATEVDELSAWWCGAYLGDHPAWEMPGRSDGLYDAWRHLARHDRRILRRGVDPNLVETLPSSVDDAVAQLLNDLGVDRPDHAAYVQRHLVRNAGWVTALIRQGGADGDDLMGYLAIRLTIELARFGDGAARRLARRAGDAAAPDAEAVEVATRRLAIWRDAYERGFRDQLLADLSTVDRQARPDGDRSSRPASHAVFCIDPRSEGLRRHLEDVGDHATIGFAGFFGLAIDVTDLDASTAVPSCPVIVAPSAAVAEVEPDGDPGHADGEPGPTRRRRGVMASQALKDVFATTKRSTSAPFALAETFGWASGAWTAAKTLAPSAAAGVGGTVDGWLVPAVETSVQPVEGRWWDLDEQVQVAASILRTTGLDRGAAPLVLLCGHGSRHLNNLHRSALDCGACGGRSGGNNARAAANLLNTPDVRRGLGELGIDVPSDTWFVAAEHDTTTDEVRILDRGSVPGAHLPALGDLEADLAEAGTRLAAERGRALPESVGRTVGARPWRIRRRRDDWAQVIPEWGLMGNAAIVVGPRSLTADLDLERRVFLHSYDVGSDADGSILAAIMGGPLLVAHWISSQYRLSTIDRDRLGAGTKPAHNLVGGVGVLEGSGGDLRLGLPLESVGAAGRAVHEPMRLLAVVDAPADRVESAIAGNPAVAQIVDNGWIRLAARPEVGDPNPGAWVLRRRDGSWTHWDVVDDRPMVTDAVAAAAA